MFLPLVSGLIVAVSGGTTLVRTSNRSGLVIPLEDGGGQKWVGLDFQGSISTFWKPGDCPPSVHCGSESPRIDIVPLFAEEAGRRVASAVLNPDRISPDRWTDVAGIVAIGPSADFAQGRMLTFRQRGSLINLSVSEPVVQRRIVNGHEVVSPMKTRWEIEGDLHFRWLEHFRRQPERIVFDLTESDLVLHPNWLFHWTTGVGKLKAIRVNDRMYVKRRLGDFAFSFRVKTKSGTFSVRVPFVRPHRVIKQGLVEYCAVAVRFDRHTDAMVLGRMLLESKDVSFDAVNGVVRVEPRLKRFDILDDTIAPPSGVYLTGFACNTPKEFDKALKCFGRRTEHISEAKLQIGYLSSLQVELLWIQDRLRVPGPVFGRRRPRISLEETSLVVVGDADQSSSFETIVMESDRGFRISFEEATPPPFPPVLLKDSCAVCLKGLYGDGLQLRMLDNCPHDFHADCASLIKKSFGLCPVCLTPT